MHITNTFKNTVTNSWINRSSTVWSDTSLPYLIISASFVEPWETPIVVAFEEPYEICTVRVNASFVEPYGEIVYKSFIEPYGDVPVITSSFVEWYNDTVTPTKRFIESYGDQREITKSFEEPYTVSYDIGKSFEEPYSITLLKITKSFEEIWDLEVRNLIQKSFEEPYYMIDGGSDIYSPSASLTINGIEIDILSVAISASTSSYCISCDINLPSMNEYNQCNYRDDVTVVLNGESFVFFIETKSRTLTRSSVNFSIGLLSPTAKLDAPYSQTIIDPLEEGINSEVFIREMAALQGITVDYQIISWDIKARSISINDETPLSVIKRVVNSVGAIVQTKPNGEMLIISSYPESPNNWNSLIPDAIFTTEYDIISLNESLDVRDGFNAFIISDQTSSSESITLEEVFVDAHTKYIRGFRIPFEDGAFDLETSGESPVTIEKYINPVFLDMPEYDEDTSENDRWEVVEFIDWTASVTKPVYEAPNTTGNRSNPNSDGGVCPPGVIEFEWIETNLGAFTIDEDGTITITDQDSVPSESLMRIKYTTKYWRWTVTGPLDIPVQFYVPELEEE